MAEIILNVDDIAEANAPSVAEALTNAIDAVVQRAKEREKLRNQGAGIAKLAEQRLLFETDEAGQLEVQKAELEKQTSLLELEKQQLELEKRRLELQEELIRLEKKRIDAILESATKIVDTLYPNIETTIRGRLVQTLISDLLQLGKELEMLPPEPGSGIEETETKESAAPLSAIARAEIEDEDKAFVGKVYSIKAGVAWNKREKLQRASQDNIVEPLTFDIMLLTSENIELLSERQMRLRSSPFNSDPQMVEFSFRALSQGHTSLAVDFYHKLHWLRTIHFEFDCVEEREATPFSA